MKKLAIKTVILVSAFSSAAVFAQTTTQTISKNASSTTQPLQADFPQQTWNYPSQVNGRWIAGYNNSQMDRMFLETMRFKVKKGCSVTGAKFNVRIKPNGRNIPTNDSFGIAQNGQSIYSVRPWSSSNSMNQSKNLSYNLASLPNGSNLLNSLTSNQRFSFYVQDDTKVQSALLRLQITCESDRKGMTWRKHGVDGITGVVHVGCGYSNGANECNPYKGDTMCKTKLPILCRKKLALDKPASVSTPNQYNQWAKQVVATTRPIAPATAGLDKLYKANQVCEKEFGKGWEVAEFHNGRHWNFKSFGNIGSQVNNKRFWVNINDQANGNCWSQQ